MAIRTVCRGTLLSFDIVSPALSVMLPPGPVYGMWSSDIQQWWLPNKLGHRHMIQVARFRVTDHRAGMRQKLGLAYAHKPLRRVRGWHDLTATLSAHLGGPSQWVLAAA